MGGEWQERTLGDLTEWSSGGTPPKSNPAFWGGNIPWISASSMKTRRLADSDRTLTPEGLERGSRLARKGDVLLLVRGSELHKRIPVGIASRNVAFNQDVKALRAKEDLDKDFLYYWLAGNETMLLSKVENTGIGAGKLDTNVLKNLRFRMPPKPDQHAIAHILGTLDDKIELNRRRNQTLEAMARALFKDWFIDFGPVRRNAAKAQNQPSPGLRPPSPSGRGFENTAHEPPPSPSGRGAGGEGVIEGQTFDHLFPDRLDDDGKPEGWKVTTLGDVAIELRRGISPSYLDSGGVRVLNQKCIRNREINFCLARRHDHSKRKIEGRTVMAGDILVNSTGVGTLGRTAQLWRIDEPTVIDSHVSVVRPNTDIVSICYLGLNLTGREAEIEMLGEGSTGQTELSRARLGCLQVLVPPRQILDQFDAKARPLLDAIFANTAEGTTLAQLRDTLLPKLISGDLRMADAEKLIESGHL